MSRFTDAGEWRQKTAAFTSVYEATYGRGEFEFKLPAGTELVVDTAHVVPEPGRSIYIVEARQAIEPMSNSRNMSAMKLRLM